LGVEARVLGESTRHNKQSLSKAVYTNLYFAADLLSSVLIQVLGARNFESAGTGQHALILNSVDDCAETITDRVSCLGNRIIVGSLDKDRAGEGVLNSLDEGVLVLSESLLVDHLGKTEIGFSHIVDGVELLTAACEGDALTISLLAATDAENASTRQNLKRGRVNTFLVNDDEVLVGALAKLFFEVDDLADSIVGELAL